MRIPQLHNYIWAVVHGSQHNGRNCWRNCWRNCSAANYACGLRPARRLAIAQKSLHNDAADRQAVRGLPAARSRSAGSRPVGPQQRHVACKTDAILARHCLRVRVAERQNAWQQETLRAEHGRLKQTDLPCRGVGLLSIRCEINLKIFSEP